uniref:Large ribosomal subunit protein bL33c n=1 Tax=Pterocladiophila hemisphaerica TaxID=2712948 RepID=A0A6M3WWC4_9FLOR|nr:ribosomal protein L33 [Pterocladiophila hemisphaerica]
MKKNSRIIIALECMSFNTNNTKHKHFYRYISQKNRYNSQNKLCLKKFCPICKKHTFFVEIK